MTLSRDFRFQTHGLIVETVWLSACPQNIHIEWNNFQGLVIDSRPSLVFTTLPNPFKTELTMVIFIHYKPRIALTILDL